MGAGLGEQLVGLLRESLDSVGAGRPTLRRRGFAGKLDQSFRELGRITALLAVHLLPRGDSLARELVVADFSLRPPDEDEPLRARVRGT
jgi:hypothetical protein